MELLLLSQFNLDSPLPTIFELVAQDRLGEALHGALKFGLTTLATAAPRVAPVLDYYDELYLALDALVQRPFLFNLDCTMAENAFGLRRSKVIGAAAQRRRRLLETAVSDGAAAAALTTGNAATAVAGTSGGGGGSEGLGATAEAPKALRDVRLAPLTPGVRRVAYLLAVLLPYVRRRLMAYTQFLRSDKPDDMARRASLEHRRPWLKPAHRVLQTVYPPLHAALELLNVAIAIGYLADRTPYFNWQFLLMGVTIRRASRGDMQAAAASPGAMRAVRVASLLLMGIAVAFRLLDWWNTGAGREASNTIVRESLPAPDPPTVPPAMPGKQQPADGNCGVCHKPFVNAAVNTVSGYVCCYPCLHQYVAEHQACPVSGMPCGLSSIRRLYDESS
jgi:hypothetical protein